MERLLELTKRHKKQMDEKNVLVSVYTNASGFLWSMMKVDSGTDLGWSDHNGDHPMSGAFTSYENALQDALDLVAKCDLKKFSKDCPVGKFHWGNYAEWLSEHYRTAKTDLTVLHGLMTSDTDGFEQLLRKEFDLENLDVFHDRAFHKDDIKINDDHITVTIMDDAECQDFIFITLAPDDKSKRVEWKDTEFWARQHIDEMD